MSITAEEAQSPKLQPRPVPDTPDSVFAQLSLKGRVCVVTGASAKNSIGVAVSEAYAEAGADVLLWYNSNNEAIQHAEDIANKYNVRAKAYQVNVSDPDAVQKHVQQAVQDFGRLDVLVANAGTGISKPILDMEIAEYKKLMEINVDSVFYCAKFAGEVFRKQGSGNLIITSSISAHIVNVPIDQPVYNASKAAVSHLGKSLAREWREFARVNIVSPGFFDTKMGAGPQVVNEAYRMAVLRRQGHVREIKGLYLYLASDASSYQTGSETLIDGGYTLP